MKKILNKLYNEARQYKFLILVIILILVVSNILSLKFIGKLTAEDGFYEYLTAIFFLSVSISFFIIFLRTRHYLNLLFVLLFFFGFGEEISWGQRIFNFKTPELVEKINRQEEFNLHNSEFLSASEEHPYLLIPKKGLRRYFNMNALWILFCFGYGILLPLYIILIDNNKTRKYFFGIPVPPIALGTFFLINYMINKSIHLKIPFPDIIPYRIDECFEFNASMIFLIITLVSLKNISPKALQ